MRKVSFFVVLVGVFLLVGCAKSMTQSTANGEFHVKMIFSEKRLKTGRNQVELKITDKNGASVDGARVEVIPTMPEHHMGPMFPPTVTDEGGGSYKVVMPLTMAGHWTIQVKITKGGTEGTATFNFPDVRK